MAYAGWLTDSIPRVFRLVLTGKYQANAASYISFRPEILKQEMKVFFVKYNDPIYVKMEKLDIMIRLAQQSNIAQVLSELKE